MWKTLTAKSNWLPVAYHLFQGKKVHSACDWCACWFAHQYVVRVWMQLYLCESLCVCERETECACALLLNSVQRLIRHTSQSNPTEV